MRGIENKDVGILRGDLDSKTSRFRVQNPPQPLNTKFIFDNGKVYQRLNFWWEIDLKSEEKASMKTLKMKAIKNSINGYKFNHFHW